MTPTRGERNLNPGNIRKGKVPWLGETGADDQGFVIFDTPEHGIRAMAKLLLNYNKKYGIRTVRGFIWRWAPDNENNTEAYIRAVANRMGVGDVEAIDLTNRYMLQKLVQAIIWHENGRCKYDDAQILSSISMAFT